MRIFFHFVLLMMVINVSIIAQPGLEPDTIFVSPGWNLIGSKYSGAVSDIVTTEPQGIISSPFFKFVPGGNLLLAGYTPVIDLEESIGYWVKVSEPGLIIVAGPLPLWNCGHPIFGGGRIWFGEKWYNTVKIGTQCWLQSNLDIGTMINGSENQTNNGVIEKYCYGNDESNCATYGGLYQWSEAMQYTTTEGAQGICPNGWHIPTEAEYEILKTYVSGSGKALKSVGQGTGEGYGTNTSGFSAVLAGGFHADYGDDRVFNTIGLRGWFWSSHFDTGWLAKVYFLNDDYDLIFQLNTNMLNGYNIRCIKD